MTVNSKPKLPKRSRQYGVGKEIGGAVYVHRDYEHLLGDAVAEAKSLIPQGFEYHVVKLTKSIRIVSFISSPDFDRADEPQVGPIITVKSGKATQRSPPTDPFIYHHKWLFVPDDYSRFDVEASKKRSFAWMSLPNIDKRRIGRLSYWQAEVVPRISEATEDFR